MSEPRVTDVAAAADGATKAEPAANRRPPPSGCVSSR